MRPFPGCYNFSFGRYKWKTIWSLPTYQLTMRFLAHFPKSIFFSKVHRKWTKKDSDKRTTGASSSFNVVSKPHIITLKKFSERVAIYCWMGGVFCENNHNFLRNGYPPTLADCLNCFSTRRPAGPPSARPPSARPPVEDESESESKARRRVNSSSQPGLNVAWGGGIHTL